ncbi:hypothetical protein HL657_10180 [Methanoculleus sp. YWC-01]|uniref:Glycerophosphoryl diester phosphodiesterase membrane domain-containing protein n=1 Tax=Methanoculleus nereidis TaxID=2735141 RepID=A0ABU3Z3Y6_9EURY|nr:hypothetical protein [Methanoculleus sp. YWC-01]MDV4343526.1 hypothetical protein [Methanoculleus sp. YWC-01]
MAEDMYAFSRLDGAFQRTKSLLWPIQWGIWLRLALIALFVGGGVSFPNTSGYTFGEGDLPPGFAESLPEIAPLIVAAFVAVLAIALIWWIIGTVLQFVFVDMLRTGDIHIRPFFGERLGKGVRLFLFQVVLTLILVLAMMAFIFMLVGIGGSGVGVAAFILVFIPFILIAALLFGIIFFLTTDFVVPIMIHEDCGVIEGWRRLFGVISGQFWQTIIYIVTRLILGLIAAIVQAVIVILALLIIAIPFVLIGIVLLAAIQAGNFTLLLALLIPYLIIAIPVVLLIAVPFVTFFRYYGLLVLEGLAPECRLLPE